MFINSILSIAFLISWKKCLDKLKELQHLRKSIQKTKIQSVSEAFKKLQKAVNGDKTFMIVKGFVHLTNKIKGQSSIYSIIHQSDIKHGRLADHFMKKSWQELSAKSYWKQPHNTQSLLFNLHDMDSLTHKILIKNCKESNLSGALNQIYIDRNMKRKSSNLLLIFLTKAYNFFVSRFPFNYLIYPSNIGEELTLYGIQDGQFCLVIGQFQKNLQNEIVCRSPKYLTKQKAYIESKIFKKQKYLVLVTCLLASLLIITGIKFVKKLYVYMREWKLKRMFLLKSKIQARSENEGQNCNCIICYENVRNIIFKPCKHYAICKDCLKLLPKLSCPYCKENIEDTIQVIKKK